LKHFVNNDFKDVVCKLKRKIAVTVLHSVSHPVGIQNLFLSIVKASSSAVYGNRLKVQLTTIVLMNKKMAIWLNRLSFGKNSKACPTCNVSYLKTLEITHWQNIQISHLKWRCTFDPESCAYTHEHLHTYDQIQSVLGSKNSDVSHLCPSVTCVTQHGWQTSTACIL